MASSSGPSLNEELQCSICVEVFTDPVTTPCGHNFCRTCLIKCWPNTQTCFCPFCNEKFSKRPDLKINTTLGKLVQHFKKLNQESELFCDVCGERKQKAVKTCLMCPSSCNSHLEPHLSFPCLNEHTLINAVENLEDYICQKHERPLELFCKDDQTCVCLSCAEGEHKTHNTVPIEEESREKKMIQDRTKKIPEIKHSVEQTKTLVSNDCFLPSPGPVHISKWMIISLGVLLVSALMILILPKQYTTSDEEDKSSSVEIFTDMIRSIERSQSDLLKMMEEQQKAAEKQAEDLIKELHQEITELKRRNTELEQLSHTEDHLHLIQMNSSLYSHPHTKNWTETRIDSDVNSLKRTLTELKKTLDETLNEKLSQTGLKFVQKFAVDVTLDPDTAYPYLILSDDGKQVSYGDVWQDVPENPKRFNGALCVLAKQGFSSGRFYYEVQVKGSQWDLGVIRESINRKEHFTLSPEDGVWIVGLWNENQYLAFDNPPVSLSLRVKPEKVGVFVDYEEGLVSFYDVESRSHIYSFTGQTFTEKLYPYFLPCYNDKGKNSNPLIITPVR